jgi:hypothetical protein
MGELEAFECIHMPDLWREKMNCHELIEARREEEENRGDMGG